MSAFFLKLLNLSITASWMILAIILVRFLLKKAPKRMICMLWALAAIRLLFPFSPESRMSLVPSIETIPGNIENMEYPAIDSGITTVDNAINPIITQSFASHGETGINPFQIVIPALTAVWIMGMAVLLIYAVISYSRLKKSTGASILLKDNIYSSDEVKSPFILGIIKPLIYVPSSMDGETLDYVITHENAHIKRFDHVWKPLGYLLLTVYWFNPLCWAAYILLCRDIEMACDEKVIRDLDPCGKAAYSQALLDCSFPRRRISACPLAFGEVGVKARIKSVLNYKKPAFRIIFTAVILCIAVIIFFMTNPYSDKRLSERLAISMDMAVAEHYQRSGSENCQFIVTDYNVLRVSESFGKAAVYAWVLYEEYSLLNQEVHLENKFHAPSVITFDTSNRNDDVSSYNVISYWVPRSGDDYENDIRSEFPKRLWSQALDASCFEQQDANCRKEAEAYFSTYAASDGQTDTYADDDHIRLSVDSLSFDDNKVSLTVLWENNSKEEIYYGEVFTMYKFNENTEKWEELDIYEDTGFVLPAYPVCPKGTRDEFLIICDKHTYTLSAYYDLSAPGKYRFETSYFFESNHAKDYYVHVDFMKNT